MRTVFFLLCFYAGVAARAQERCITPIYPETKAPASLVKDLQTESPMAKQGAVTAQATSEAVVIKIPVVVHLLYNTASQNISDAQINSQITALNEDYRRKNKDTANTPLRFRSIAADVQIEFYLATADPLGRPTSGIIRKQNSSSVWLANDRMKSSALGGDDAWDSKSYLNIWICNLAAGLGYASLPGSDAAKDGVVINYTAFGTVNVSGAYNLGRTAVHEIGHWLGLKHIWGDEPCGDDGVADTPKQSGATKGCPAGFVSSCNNGELGDMYQNFMDYTYDACMNLFTEGQKARMRSLFADGGQRASLLQSKGLQKPWSDESVVTNTNAKTTVYPNPATTEITISTNKTGMGKSLSVINSNGVVLVTIAITSAAQKIPVATLKPGLYFIKGDGILERFIKL